MGGRHLLQVRDQLVHQAPGGPGLNRGWLHHAVSLHQSGREQGPHRPVYVPAASTLQRNQVKAHRPAGDKPRYGIGKV